MFKAIYRTCASVFVLGVFLCSGRFATAQVAPTTTATISGSVSDIAGKPVAGAHLTLTGPTHAVTQTDTNGLFVFVGVSFGEYVLSSSAPGLGTATRTFSVQGDTNVAVEYQPASVNGLKTIAKVSSTTNARFNITPASITQVSPTQNAFEGRTSWRTILEQIPGIATAGLGNGGFIAAALPDGPLVGVQISINGGLPYETSTLLDGMPIIGRSATQSSPGAGTDLGVYPLNAFGAADVVRGPGAASPSIVDSIGGSFVLHAPNAVTQNHSELSVSNDAYGGIVLNALSAVRFGKLSATATFGLNNSPGPMHQSGIPQNIEPFYFATFLPPGAMFVNGTPFVPNGTYLSNPNYSSVTFPTYGWQTSVLACCLPQDSAWNQHTGSIALNYAVSSKVNAAMFYTASDTREDEPWANGTTVFTPPAGYGGPIAGGSYLFSGYGDNIGPAPMEEFARLLEEKLTVELGRGTLQLAAFQNLSGSTQTSSTPASITLHLFGGGTYCTPACTTPAIFNGGTYTVTPYPSSFYFDEYTHNRDMLLSYQTPFGENYHAGFSYVKSYYNTPTSTYFQNLPSGISETTNEMRLFVGGDLSPKTSVDLTGYFVRPDYHVPAPGSSLGFGDAYNYTDISYTYAAPRLGFVWRPTTPVAVRLSAGGGVAISPLDDLFPSGPFDCGTFYTETIANPHLQPEKSFAFDLGTDIQLHRNTIVSLDVYQATLHGQLYQTSGIATTNYNGSGLPLYATQYVNLGVSRYEGILADVHHDVPHGIFWRFSGGLTRGYAVSLPPGFYNAAGATCNFATLAGCTNLNLVPGINFNGTETAGAGGQNGSASIPYAQALGVFGYRWNPDKYVNLTATYYGNNNTYFHPAFVEVDGYLGYPLTRNVSLVVNVRNITGIYDGSVQNVTLGNFSGTPAIAGPPYAENQEEYGPRAVIVTTQVHL